MQLFYSTDLTEQASTYSFSKEESKHIHKVLRKSEGDRLHVTNGKGLLCKGIITFANAQRCDILIEETHLTPPKPYRLHMVVAPVKMNDRFEWFLEKATEIGVDEITPILCDHSERKVIKPERYEKILQSAMKQSQQTFLPKLNGLIPFSEFLTQEQKGILCIAHCEDGQKQNLKTLVVPKQEITILIGPEGDFSPDEIQKALNYKFQPITLGATRLRTETAAIAAVHSVAFINS
ncbi:16S rRNA (uracil(1498)-N(3))-methyltransferase [Aquimarina intermedia]|uniref:Ribosomal RNA small subunit methyltransferase E n=1 Tax=Aquimarina intermedia TaxID=350814 RepID=A0A5S5C433_9FLAO|nr:16S rRNA (uracil(1498)-N(3))-methyltransferase [Aquimarina intermedia]TYP74195.1 16S rRNA (uracil1498-N3)-methyltransferase [Aquimarina intermedia]